MIFSFNCFFTFFLYLLPWPDGVKFKYRLLCIHSKGLLKEIIDHGKLYSFSSPLLRADLDCLITSPIFFTLRNLPLKLCFPVYTSAEWKLPFYFLVFLKQEKLIGLIVWIAHLGNAFGGSSKCRRLFKASFSNTFSFLFLNEQFSTAAPTILPRFATHLKGWGHWSFRPGPVKILMKNMSLCKDKFWDKDIQFPQNCWILEGNCCCCIKPWDSAPAPHRFLRWYLFIWLKEIKQAVL